MLIPSLCKPPSLGPKLDIIRPRAGHKKFFPDLDKGTGSLTIVSILCSLFLFLLD